MPDPQPPAPEARDDACYANTDRELWRKGDGDGNGMSYYEPSIHVTDQGEIGIAVGGMVYVRPVEEWHALAARLREAERERDATRNALLMSAAANRGVNARAEAAEARVRELEEALRKIAEPMPDVEGDWGSETHDWERVAVARRDIARRALAGKDAAA